MTNDKTKFDSKFYLTAQDKDRFDGTIQLPTGTRYVFLPGRGLYANEGPKGTWYRGDVIAYDHDRQPQDARRFADDARIAAAKKKDGLAERSTLKPLEIRLNPWPGGKADLIGNLWTSEGVFTIFADKATEKGKLVLKGSIKPAQPKLSPDADAAHDNAEARAQAAGAPRPPTNQKT